MRHTMILASAVALIAPSLSAQQVRWNDRASATWSDEAPRVRVSIDGSRGVWSGTPMRVRFEASDNAFVTVVSVDDDGRMQILYPYSRTQRAAVRGGQVYYARNPRLGGQASFIAVGSMGGYVFALASYAPLDFSMFENRDYERLGSYSRFTVANRNIARRPDVFIDRFAAAVLWDKDTPYDYDVDYYFPMRSSGAMNAYAMCGSLYRTGGGWTAGAWTHGDPWWRYVDWELTPYPLRSMCRDWYQGLNCIAAASIFTTYHCNYGTIIANGPTTPVPPVTGEPTDSTPVPNEGVVRGGLFAPTPVPVPVNPNGDPVLPAERSNARFDKPAGADDLEGVLSIPPRATRKMKEDDARREKVGADASSPTRTGFDRAADTKPDKGSTVSTDAVTRTPPPREPTKAKGTSDTNRDRDNVRTNRGYGNTGRTSEPRSTTGPDRVSRPVESSGGSAAPGSTVSPPTIQSAGEKKKPPQDY